ncbi:MAG: STAS-like domain-containing protein, partial [Myxococcaceae bacterium]
LKNVFDAYSNEDMAFSRTRTWVKLFDTGLRFISRSEAKRLLVGLDAFEEIVLDFKDVTEIGQGFADELFRVWARAHPGVKLEAVNTTPAVQFMLKLALSNRA